MRVNVRRTLLWPAMILAGLALGGYAFAAWPDPIPSATSHHAPVSAAAPERELASVGGAYPSDIFVYELRSTMLIDSIMATPQPVDAH